MAVMSLSAQDNPSVPSDAFKEMEGWRLLPRTLNEGTDGMRAARNAHGWLPPSAGEQADGADPSSSPYNDRVRVSVLVPFFSDAVKTLVGKATGQEIGLAETAPPDLITWAKNVNNRGDDMAQFAAPLFSDMWIEGLPLVLVDHSERNDVADAEDSAELELPLLTGEQAKGRPYWIYYPSASVITAEYGFDGGVLVWQRIRLWDNIEAPAGKWGTKEVKRIRVLHRGNPSKGLRDRARYAWFEFLRMNADGSDWIVSEEPGEEPGILTPHVEIPAVLFPFGEVMSPTKVKPELKHLADLCCQHWRERSEMDAMIRRCKLALLHLTGTTQASFEASGPHYLGPMELTISQDPNAVMQVVETTGASGKLGFEGLDRLEKAIAAASMKPQIPQAPAAKTLGEKIIDTTIEDSRLRKAAGTLKGGLIQLVRITALQWGMPIDPALKDLVIVPLEFSVMAADPAELTAIIQARAEGILSLETTIGALVRSIRTLADVDPTEEAKAVVAERAQAALEALARVSQL